ncbi:FxSxx-COOH cyclophane-containing RiPP peptide [Streptomyces shenzhenensis]|uniref:FxSxx-COOH cyclophane-containing RiPP peptide n=1 Tax=Streptomyces TaxID=1883 RepID=UPI001F2B063B|nr:FxSxx-COOH cyclophane-containing RiPP peptide [Streptomyces shenzhenensis]
MDAREQSLPEAEPGDTAEPARAAGAVEPLPDLLELDLAQLKEVDHPVLREVLAELRERAVRPTEMLWGFNNAF